MVLSRVQGTNIQVRNTHINQHETLVEIAGKMEKTGTRKMRCQIVEQDWDHLRTLLSLWNLLKY